MNKFLDNKLQVSLTAGLLLGLSFPPVDLSFLTIPAFVLLFHLSEKCDSNKQLAYYGYFGFVLWNLIGTYWLMMASAIAGIAAILANAVIMTIPLVLFRGFSRSFEKSWHIALLQASAWVAYEFLHHNWDLSWTWLSIGNAWANQIGLVQYISATGHLGITFWVIFTASLAYSAIKKKNQIIAIAATFSLLLPSGTSFLYYVGSGINPVSSTTNVTVIQPNHDSYLDYGGMRDKREVLDSLFSITKRTKAPETDLVVWPENAIDGVTYINSVTTNRVADSAKAWNTAFISGTGLYKLYDTPPTLYRDTFQGRARNFFNSALYVNKSGKVSRYDKHNLVPIVERFPFVDFFNAIDVFRWFNWGRIAQFGKGTEPIAIIENNFTTQGLICYDSVYPEWIREFVRNGTDFITIITNDGWWGNSSGHVQHFSYARLRAIEFDRWIVRSANNGTSGIIDPSGRVIIKTHYWTKTGFNFEVPHKNTMTLFTKFGDWFSYLCLLIVIPSWIWILIKKRFTANV